MMIRSLVTAFATLVPAIATAASIEAPSDSITVTTTDPAIFFQDVRFESDGEIILILTDRNYFSPGFCDPLDGSGCDAGYQFANGTSVFVDWVDDDSFDVGFFGGSASAFSIEISEIRPADASAPLDFVFNLSSSAPFNDLNIEDFLASAENPSGAPAPAVTTQLSVQGDGTFDVELSVSGISDLLLGDGPTMRFDLLPQDVQAPEVVPLPAGGLLLLSGLAVFGAVRRRRKS